MRGNIFVAAVLVVALVGLSAGGSYAAGRSVGERRGAESARQATITELQGQFQQALARVQESGGQSSSGTGAQTGDGQEAPAASGRSFGGAGFGAGRGAIGRVEKVEGDRMTLTSLQGVPVTVVLGQGTSLLKTVAASRADLQPGVQVSVTGERQADGTIQATHIALGQAGR